MYEGKQRERESVCVCVFPLESVNEVALHVCPSRALFWRREMSEDDIRVKERKKKESTYMSICVRYHKYGCAYTFMWVSSVAHGRVVLVCVFGTSCSLGEDF